MAGIVYNMRGGCRLHIKTFEQLTTSELYALLQTRSAVFIVEQQCIYQDVDDCDQTAIHLWISDENGKIVAMCRICPRETKMQEVSIGRVITTEREKGFGTAIMRAAIDTAKSRIKNLLCIDIEAQADKKEFYEKFGFVQISEPFMMEGLYHMHMRYTL